MRRSTSRIGKLPPALLEEVNEKLYAGWEYPQVRKWLFEEVAVEDVPALGLVKGEKFGQVWLRSAKSAANAGHFCELALGNWFRGWHALWVREKLRRGESMRIVRKANALTRAAAALEDRESTRMDAKWNGAERQPLTRTLSPKGRGDERRGGEDARDEVISISGGDVIMRSVLIDAISSVEENKKDSKEIAQLANAWARLNQGRMEEEKLKLKTEEALTAGLRAVKEQIQALPEALELFYKMTDVIDRSMKDVDPLAK